MYQAVMQNNNNFLPSAQTTSGFGYSDISSAFPGVSSSSASSQSTRRINDLSGAILDYKKLLETNVEARILEPLDKSAVDSNVIIRKFRDFTAEVNRLSEEQKTLETELQKFQEIQTNTEEIFTQLFSGLAKMTKLTETEFNDFMDKKKGFLTVLNKVAGRIKDSHSEKIKGLNAKLSTYNENLADIRSFMIEGVKLAFPNSTPTLHACPVCFEKEANVCAVPCGHTLCEGCIEKLSSSQCPACRTTVTSKVKLFFS